MKKIIIVAFFSFMLINPALAWDAYSLRSDYNSSNNSGYRYYSSAATPFHSYGSKPGDIMRVNSYGETWVYTKSTRIDHNKNTGNIKIYPLK